MAARTLQTRVDVAVTSCGVGRFTDRELNDLDVQEWWVDKLREAERSIRDLRVQLEARLVGNDRRCLRCGKRVAGRADKKYCSDRCRIEAHRHKLPAVWEEGMPESVRRKIEERDRNS